MDIEQFPVQKRVIQAEEPADLIFFDVDEAAEEAEFIRVDDLFRDEPELPARLSGWISLVLFPRSSGQLIDSRFSRIIRKTVFLTAAQLHKSAEKIRVRPMFVQWQIELDNDEEAEPLIREFHRNLEAQSSALKTHRDNEKYWSNSCFVCPADTLFTDDKITQMVALYQK